MHSDVNQPSSCIYVVYLTEHNYKTCFSLNFYLSSLKDLEFELGNVELYLPSDLASHRLEVHVFFKDKTIYCRVYIHINIFCKTNQYIVHVHPIFLLLIGNSTTK